MDKKRPMSLCHPAYIASLVPLSSYPPTQTASPAKSPPDVKVKTVSSTNNNLGVGGGVRGRARAPLLDLSFPPPSFPSQQAGPGSHSSCDSSEVIFQC